ncbi:MAG: hypothetical protein A2087_03045 [Spirochaetes bacterium GWD1_61_31]|nr:MAG: hypothetical protein A2Y37_14140 [Spirochaetes bacterium GWB1_60_80]OHD34720.1 MAG: hypothetical protein A2004_00110 [Spirochaetes bacterium GWC1_61_12]OHD38746.1 MAG: hypothetical protein A2087_03045 [Spirochaetes bacterium GWD1_61_31]OHD44491.1 MAG: hypothetical protein A2Y35_04980 [Spirochaetes bacterium GWE1_60_18]OHD59359.1 MAG: hypothetical protein A2Y32_08515 [Spirochaetes bacterium GWF1_60_12]HAP43141.1 hypothetical protein [Spirochaetaceae bacterium]
MKRVMTIVMLVSIPLVLLALVIQSAAHYSLTSELRLLEKQQAVLVEANRTLLSEISQAAARERVEAIVRQADRFVPIGPANTLRILIQSAEDGLDG